MALYISLCRIECIPEKEWLHINFLVDALPEKLCTEHWMVKCALNRNSINMTQKKKYWSVLDRGKCSTIATRTLDWPEKHTAQWLYTWSILPSGFIYIYTQTYAWVKIIIFKSIKFYINLSSFEVLLYIPNKTYLGLLFPLCLHNLPKLCSFSTFFYLITYVSGEWKNHLNILTQQA